MDQVAYALERSHLAQVLGLGAKRPGLGHAAEVSGFVPNAHAETRGGIRRQSAFSPEEGRAFLLDPRDQLYLLAAGLLDDVLPFGTHPP